MSEKTEKNKRGERGITDFDKKSWIMMGITFVALLVVVFAIIQFNQNTPIDSSYFHDSEGKIVMTMERDMAALEDSEYEPYLTHVVYFHDGNKATGARVYYEYINEAEAEKALPNLTLGDFADSKTLNGRFVVFQVKKSQYEDTTVEELRNDVELLKGVDGLVLDYGDGYINRYGELIFSVDEYEDFEDGAESDGAEAGGAESDGAAGAEADGEVSE